MVSVEKKYLNKEKKKFLNIGKQKPFRVFSDQIDWIKKDNFLLFAKKILFRLKKELIIIILLILTAILFLF